MEIETTVQKVRFICSVNYDQREVVILDGDKHIKREMVDFGSNYLDDLSVPYRIDMQSGIYEWSGTVEWVGYDGFAEPVYEGEFKLLYTWQGWDNE